MITAITLSIVYLIGNALCYQMLKVEHLAEKKPYTIGDRLMALALSSLSWLLILIMITRSWVEKINATGYWNTPINPDSIKEDTE